MKKIPWLFLIFFLFLPLYILSSDGGYVRFDHVPLEFEGKVISEISSILQDREGFLWFGTGHGLVRYDGYRFNFFTHDPSRKDSLSNDIIYPIYEDSAGMIWAGTHGGGLNRFNIGDETFTHFSHDPENPNSLSDDIVMAIIEDRNADLWIGTRFGGLNRFDRDTETFTRMRLKPDIGSIWDLCADSEGYVWIGTQNAGLFKLDPVTEEFVNYQHDPNSPDSLGDNRVWSIFEDGEGMIWAGTNRGGLNRYIPEKDGFIRYYGDKKNPDSLKQAKINAIIEDSAGKLWIGTDGDGLRIFDKKTRTFLTYKHDPNDTESLSGNIITSIYQDDSGIIWVGTARSGLNKSLHFWAKFQHDKHNPYNPYSLNHNDVRSLYPDSSGNLWVGTDRGLNKINMIDRSVIHYAHNPSNPDSLSHNSVRAILEDDEGLIWLGTSGGGLNRFDPQTGRFTHYKRIRGVQNSLISDLITCLRQDGQDEDILWIGTERGLDKYNTRTQRYVHFQRKPEDSNSISDNHVLSLFEDRTGILWVGTLVGGLNRLDKESGDWTRYVYDIKLTNSISHKTVTSILEDRSLNFWVGTGQGLNRFDRANGEWKVYSENEGLAGEFIYGILEDNLGNLWLSTNRGISKFDPDTETFTNFDISDGVQSDSFHPGGSLKSNDGKLFFWGVNGYNSFYPEKIKKNPYLPPLVWTAFYKLDKRVKLDKPLAQVKNLTLSPGDDYISFEFAALCFACPEKNRYAFKLEGRDKDWIDQSANRIVSLSNLPPGEYTLRVKGSNPDGVWNEDGPAINIKVPYPFWKTSWFRIIVLLAAAALFFAVYKTVKKSKIYRADYEQNLKKIFTKYGMTSREEEILRLILKGYSNREIEKKLFISENTVRNHVYNIYQKLKVKNRLELVNLIREHTRENL